MKFIFIIFFLIISYSFSFLLNNKIQFNISDFFQPHYFFYIKEKWYIPSYFLKFKKEKNTKKKFNLQKTNLKETLSDKYLDQVVNRKKEVIYQCAKKKGIEPEGLLVEMTIFPTGKTQTRLINSAQTNKEVIQCSLNVLNRIKFKKFSGPAIQKGYYFQFN